MVEIIPVGRFGNVCLIYFAAMSFALKNSLRLAPWPMPEWVQCTLEQHPYRVRDFTPNQTIEINDGNFHEWFSKKSEDIPDARYVFRGYFQFLPTLENCVGFMRAYFAWKDVPIIDEDSICMHARGTDHGNGSLIVASEFFASILEKEKFKYLHVITDDKFCEPMFTALRKWNPEIRCSPNAMDDFNWMRQHRKIIIPNSTFSLVAAITGHAWNGGTIYQFKRGQCIPYIQQTLSRAIQVDGPFWREVSR